MVAGLVGEADQQSEVVAHTGEVAVDAAYLTGPLSAIEEEPVDVVPRRCVC